MPASTTTDELLNLTARLNSDENVSAILVQQPMPAQIDMPRIVLALDPVKDVDGFHPVNVGLVALGLPGGVRPCTPAGIIELLDHEGFKIEGAHPVVSGRSNLVANPPAFFLLHPTP